MQNINTNTMTEKLLLEDVLSNQKFISANYNIWAGECVNVQLKNDLLQILDEEQEIQHEIFQELSGRGWYQVKAAEQTEVDTVKQKFQGVQL